MKKTLKKYSLFLTSICLLISTCIYFYNRKNISSITTSTIIQEEKIAYLTFDDGPSSNTEKILEILDKYNIKATFFVVGPSYNLKDRLLKKIVKSGHQLAIHSYEHNYSYIYSSLNNYLNDFYKCYNWIKETTNTTPNLYRFPGGSSNTIASKKLITSIIAELETRGFIHADWNVDTLDSYVKNDSSKIISNAMTSIKKNENNHHYYQTILLHDDNHKPASVEALPSLIEKIISKGYKFETLTDTSNLIQHIKI